MRLIMCSAWIALSALLLVFSSAFAENRVALVIGNSAYRNAPALVNPKNDAEDVGHALKDLGFDTMLAPTSTTTE